MSTIDRAALIEQAATAIDNFSGRNHNYGLSAALPVIAKALLAPLRELHTTLLHGPTAYCATCALPNPCPTVLLLDAIEAEVQP